VPDVIGSAVVATARRAAGLTRPELARSLSVKPATVRGCENSEVPPYCVPYAELRRLVLALTTVGSEPGEVLNCLLIAGQFDLLVSEMLAGSADYAELPSIGTGTACGVVGRNLPAWAFGGIAPDRYRQFTRPGCLYGRADRRRIILMLDELRLGTNGELAGYATALLALMRPNGRLVRSRGRMGLRRLGRSAGWWFRRVAR
jgi:hypothetical protein